MVESDDIWLILPIYFTARSDNKPLEKCSNLRNLDRQPGYP